MLLVHVKTSIDTPINSINHQMRKRSIPHVEGNWATHVFIDCKYIYSGIIEAVNKRILIILGPLKTERLQDAISMLADEFSDVHLIDSVHVSCSKTFILRFHWIDSFFSSLRDQFKKSSPFQLQFSSDVLYLANEDKTRHFACIMVSEWCHQTLSSVVEMVDKCLQELSPELPTYYRDKKFHISLLWKLTEFTPEEKSKISSTLKDLKANSEDLLKLFVDKISCKSGNKLTEILL